MEIRRIDLFYQQQPFVDGTYTCSGNRTANGFDSTLVRIETNDGHQGWGEMAPLGSFYDPAFVAGARAGMRELAPQLLGYDCRNVAVINERMDFVLKGHGYAKSAIDMACWDCLARQQETPLAQALGGPFGTRIALYRSISQQSPEQMAERARQYIDDGYKRLQVKVGLDVDDDIRRIRAIRSAVPGETILFADANGAWTTTQAREFLQATTDLRYVLEQPCASYEENKRLRSVCERPLVLDEDITDFTSLVEAANDQVADGVTIKIARVGGVTKAKLLRDAAVALGLTVTIEDTGGAQIDTAAIAHLMLSTPLRNRVHTVDFHNWVTVANGVADFDCRDGEFSPPGGGGLGVHVEQARFGEPDFSTTT